LGVGDRAFQQAVSYANERVQGRPAGAATSGHRPDPGSDATIVDHPDVRRMLLTMRAYLEALRCVLYLNAESIDLATAHPDEVVRTARGELVDLLTPISKAWGTDLGVEVTSLAVQVYGGMGYIEEAGVAQHYRDIRIAPIYEGTNGIQAIDLVSRKLGLRGGAVVADFLAGIDATAIAASAAGGELKLLGDRLAEASGALRAATEWLLEHDGDDPDGALAGATPYLRMAGLVTGGWLLTRSALAAAELLAGEGAGFPPAFLEDKLVTARFYLAQLLPQAAGLLPAVTAGAAVLRAASF
jgi:hypothetical protein